MKGWPTSPTACLVVAEHGILIIASQATSEVPWPAADAEDPVRDLAEAFRTTLVEAGFDRVAIVAMPPLADVRVVGVPSLRQADTTAVLENHPGRYFPDRRGDRSIAWEPTRSDTGRQVIVAGVDTRALELVLAAVESRGLQFVDPIPAHACWSAAGLDLLAADGGIVCVELATGFLVLTHEGEALVSVARFRACGEASLVDRLCPAGSSADVVVIGVGDAADRLVKRLADRGEELRVQRVGRDPVAVAADRAATAMPLRIVPPSIRARRQRARRRAERWRWLFAGLLVLGAGGVDLVRLDAELSDVRRVRATLREDVDEALALRRRIAEGDDFLQAVRTHAEAAVDWASRLRRVIGALPVGTSVETLRGRGLDVELAGEAPNLAGVVAALEALKGVVAVEMTRPARRADGSGDSVRDYFTLTVRFGSE